ncbi:MAG: DNA polymerase III subunit gamma/tau [Cyanobacteria bacterium J06639_1]
MAYEPLHHKYRPQRFAEVVGQTAVVQALSNAIRSDRIAPAYLFCGPRGTGKTSSARILSKSLNCERGMTVDPCNRCPSCVSITAGSSLDVIEIDAASNTGVDNIRELIERSQFAPASSRFKVYVLDEVHMLSTAAFNALLKTLEEPPPHVIFVLATTDPQRVLPTVISRCQRFDFRRIPLEAMVDHLTDIAWKENIDITSPALELIAQIAQGGLRDAESLLDQLSLLGAEVNVEAVWDLVGAVPERDLLSLLDAIATGDRPQVVSLSRHLLDSGKEPMTLLDNLTGFYRDLLLAKTAPDRRELAALTQPTWDALVGRASQFSLQDIHAIHHRLLEAQPLLRQTTQPRLWLEVSLLDLLEPLPVAAPAAPRPPATPTETRSPASSPAVPVVTAATPAPPPTPVTQATPSIAPKAPPAPSQNPAPIATTPTPPLAASSASLLACWDEFLNRLSPVTKARCRLGNIQAETEREVTIAFPTLGFANNARERLKDLLPVAQELLGRDIKLNFVAGMPTTPPPAAPPADTPAISPSSPPTPEPREAIAPPAPRQPHSPPPSVSPQTPDEPDDLHRAARKLADFFSGSIVDASDPASDVDPAADVDAAAPIAATPIAATPIAATPKVEPAREEAPVGAIASTPPAELDEEDDLPF